jgi:hypothetical protein
MVIVKTILDAPLESSGITLSSPWDDVIKKQDSPEWKLKRVCCEIVNKFMFHTKVLKKDTQRQLRENFTSTYSPGLLMNCVQYLKMAVSNVYVSPKCVRECLMAIYYGIQNDSIFEKVHPHLESVLLDICIPLLGLNAKD